MSQKNFDFTKIAIAIGTGAAYGGAMQLAAKKIAFVNDNFTTTRSVAAAVLGSGLQYFAAGKSKEQMQVAGYALLGVAGDSGARAVASMMQSDEGRTTTATSTQGLGAIADKHKKLLANVCDQVRKNAPGNRVKQLPITRPGEVAVNPFQRAGSGAVKSPADWLKKSVTQDIYGLAN